MKILSKTVVPLALLLCAAGRAPAQDSFKTVAAEVNKKMVKLFGAGGFKGLPSYGTGILVSPKGHILTVNNHILTTVDLRVHLYDGRFYHAKVVAREPGLDVALVKIEERIPDLRDYFDFDQAAKGKLASPGDWVLAFSNCFLIATRDEPMTVQRSVIAAVTDLRGRKGVFEAPFSGEVYFGDGIFCNPGAAGGCLTNTSGELLGIIGRELKNTQSDTWINYAVPIQATTEIMRKDKKVKVDMATFVREAIENNYKEGEVAKTKEDRGGFHGIVLVANAVSATPPYVEEVMPKSPASEAGLRPDDLIVYVDGELVPTITTFKNIMRFVGPGTEVKLDVQRREIGENNTKETKLIRVKLKVSEQPKAP
jgi:serine protease Do